MRFVCGDLDEPRRAWEGNLARLLAVTSYYNDFVNFTSGQDGTSSLAADAGSSVAITAGIGGIVAATTGATDNNEALVKMTNDVFQMLDDQPIICEARIQYAEAATNAANVMFGLMDSIGADALLDNGAGPKASWSGAIIYKVDGGSVWRCNAGVGANSGHNDTVTNVTAGGSGFVTLRIEIKPINATQADVMYYIDPNGGQCFRPMTGASNRPIKPTIPITSAAAMGFGVYVKAGSANSEVVKIDYQYAIQRRASA